MVNSTQTHESSIDRDAFLANVELAIESRFWMAELNEPLQLYHGPVTIDFGGGIRIPEATVTWEWRREPIILCHFDPTDDQLMKGNASDVLSKPHKVKLEDINVAGWAACWESKSCGSKHHETLRFIRPITLGSLQSVRSARLHLVNCPDLSDTPVRTASGAYSGKGRLKLCSAEWQILVDAPWRKGDIGRDLDKYGGQAITHVAEIRRIDGCEFSIEDLNEIITALQNFLSFATGTSPIVTLPSGYDLTGQRLWEVWEACHAAHWEPFANWASDPLTGHVASAFPAYMARRSDDEWREPIDLAIRWYVQARHRGVETAIVLGQAALELLANTMFERSSSAPCGAKEWDSRSWPASRRIRWLLNKLSIPVSIPPKMTHLLTFALPDGKNFDDGPHAITELRNAITHPKKHKRAKFAQNVDRLRREVALTTLFFIEHSLLALIGFQGIASAESTHGCLVGYGEPQVSIAGCSRATEDAGT